MIDEKRLTSMDGSRPERTTAPPSGGPLTVGATLLDSHGAPK